MEEGLKIIIAPERLFYFFAMPVTNTLLATIAASFALIAFALWVRRRLNEKPGGLQNFLEWIVEMAFGLMEEILGDKKAARRLFPLIITIFLFIWLANWMEFLPGFGSIKFYDGHEYAPLLRSVNTDLNVTLALALISMTVIEAAGIAALGLKRYGSKFFNFRGPLLFFIGLIELISEAARLVSFSFRLFGNIFAGEVLILVLTFFLPVLLPVPIMAFEIFVGVIQAAIFAGLTLIFVKMAITPHEEGH